MHYVSVPGFNMHSSIFVLIYTLGLFCIITLPGKGQQVQSYCPMEVYFLACGGKGDHNQGSCVGSARQAGK